MKLNEELRRDCEVLRCDYEALRAATQQVSDERDQLKQQVEELRATNKQLTHMLWGRKSERRSGDSRDRLLPEFVSQFEEPQDPAVITATEPLQEKLDEDIIAKGGSGDIPGFAPLSSRNHVGNGKRDAL